MRFPTNSLEARMDPIDPIDYQSRYAAINDALWLLQRGPRDPNPPKEPQNTRASYDGPMYATGFVGSNGDSGDPRYAEVSLALDIARFLLDEELLDDDDEEAA